MVGAAGAVGLASAYCVIDGSKVGSAATAFSADTKPGGRGEAAICLDRPSMKDRAVVEACPIQTYRSFALDVVY